MSHLVCYNRLMIIETDMKEKTEIQQDPKTGKRTLVTVRVEETAEVLPSWMSREGDTLNISDRD